MAAPLPQVIYGLTKFGNPKIYVDFRAYSAPDKGKDGITAWRCRAHADCKVFIHTKVVDDVTVVADPTPCPYLP